MGKLKRQKVDKKYKSVPFSNALGDDFAKPSNRNRTRDRKDDDEQFVDDRLSKKILQQAREQQDDLEEEFGLKKKHAKTSSASTSSSFQFKRNLAASDDEDEDSCEEENINDEFYEDVQLGEEDEKALAVFMNQSAPAKRTLADIIMEKLTEKQTEIRTQLSDAGSFSVQDMDERVIAMYKGVAEVLSHYRSGKLPKAFKVIPSLTNWEQVLHLTEPDKWTAAAMYQATRIFVSNLKEKMVQRFVNLVLFPRVRDDIAEFKKLNFHLYQALRKSLFKPGAFFKGIILPLCEARDSTLREAIILGSVMAKNSIPMFHSAAAMLKIAEMEYSGANSIFLRVLLDKKYALPYRVVDALVYHFLGFRNEKRELPVLWHQSLLTFVQRYKEDISEEQKDSLKELLKIQRHHQITPEVQRELQHAVSRGTATKERTDDMQTDPSPE